MTTTELRFYGCALGVVMNMVLLVVQFNRGAWGLVAFDSLALAWFTFRAHVNWREMERIEGRR